MKIYFIAFVVFPSVLAKIGEGREAIAQRLDKPLLPLAVAVQLGLNVSSVYNQNEPKDEALSKVGVVLPDVPCSPEHNCSQYDDDDLTCVDGQCVCLPHLCWVYHHESSAWVSRNVFSCGQCGQLGSSCYNSSNCDPPGECWKDNYCHCPVGENYNGICTVIDDSWAYKFTLAGFGIVFLVSLLLMLVHLYRNRSWNQHGPCCCCCLCKRRKDSGAASCEKTPAYTIRNHYLYNFNDEVTTEAAASTNNPGPQPTGPRGSNTRVENGSITSVETESTNISVSSVQNIQNRRETATNANLQDQVNPTTSTSRDMQRTAVPTTITSSEDGVEENHSADLIGNCHHERCGLCLPKGLSTRETNKNTDSPASGCSPPGTCTDSGCESFDGNLATYYNSEDECTSL
ncbi:uncharacterized protein [Palaemon carinicauda]|uniref:uncharacterized protein n=1 Tax=Palaemon carinicauda TaxID=392227 RepID=UPI0035B59926